MNATAELVRKALRVTPSESALRALRDAARAPGVDWERLVGALEMHGVLGLAARNLALAGVEWPEPSRVRLRERLRALAHDAACFRQTLVRFLRAAGEAGVTPILLKGSSLALDLYPRDDLRAQGDIDVLLAPSAIGAAIAAAARAGLFPGDRDFPAWWYRLSHFHLALRPATALGREVELHWRLHAPALLLTDDVRKILARAVPVRAGTVAALALDPFDRYLHLATHLVSHAHGALPAGLVETLLAHPEPPVRLKWLLDLAGDAERLCGVAAAADLAARAAEWGAGPQLAGVLDLLFDEGLVDAPGAREWIADVRRRLPDPAPARSPVPEAAPAGGLATERPHGALGFRLESLRGLPRWIWPPLGYLRRRHGLPAGIPGAVLAAGLRILHALGVTARVLAAAALFPAALAGRALLARGRRRARAAALAPDAVLDLVAGLRGRESAPQ